MTEGTKEYVATYDNFTVGSATETYAITSLGSYYGDAGTVSLCGKVSVNFTSCIKSNDTGIRTQTCKY